MQIIGSVISDDCRVLSLLLVQQSGLLWLILTATVANHSASPATDVLTMLNGAQPICVLKVSERLQTPFLKILYELHFQWYHVLMLHNRSCLGNRIDDSHGSKWSVFSNWSDLCQMCVVREWKSISKVSVCYTSLLAAQRGLWKLLEHDSSSRRTAAI